MKMTILHGSVRISSEDADWAKTRRWHLGDTGYAKTYSGRPGGTPLRMHRLIMGRVLGRELQAGEYVDHINGDKLDNRRENLRLVTKAQNGWNRKPPRDNKSGYTGVHFDVKRSRWMVYINVNGQRFNLPACATAEESAWMRDQYAVQLHGDYAQTNFDYLEVPRQDRAEVAS